MTPETPQMELEKNQQGKVVGPCLRCGLLAHEHDRERVDHGDARYSYDYYCPEEALG